MEELDYGKDFEDGILSVKEMAKKYSVSTTTIYNWKKRWQKNVEEKKQDDKISSFAKYATEIADRNVKDGINDDIKRRINSFIVSNKFDTFDALEEVYEKFDTIVAKHRVVRLLFEVEIYLGLSCLFDPKVVNDNKYFHYIVSHREVQNPFAKNSRPIMEVNAYV